MAIAPDREHNFAWLPKGGNKLIDVVVPGASPGHSWGDVYGIQWDGKYFVLYQQYIYRIALIHAQAYYVGETPLDDPSYGPYWIYNNKPSGQGTLVVGGVTSDSRSIVNFWHYPAGGQPFYGLSHGLDRPYGVTVSLKRPR